MMVGLSNFRELFDRQTLCILLSAALLAWWCDFRYDAGGIALPPQTFIWGVLNLTLEGFANTFFHEIFGHTAFGWMLGHISLPFFEMDSSNFGGGHTVLRPKSLWVQIAAWAAMGYGCYWLKQRWPILFIPAVIFSLAMVGVSLSAEEYQRTLMDFMGPGSAMLSGGFLLFCALVDLQAFGLVERWLEALFGSSILIYNIHYSYEIAYNPAIEAMYRHITSKVMGETQGDDYSFIADRFGWTLHSVAVFSIGYGIVVLIGAFVAAAMLKNDFMKYPE